MAGLSTYGLAHNTITCSSSRTSRHSFEDNSGHRRSSLDKFFSLFKHNEPVRGNSVDFSSKWHQTDINKSKHTRPSISEETEQVERSNSSLSDVRRISEARKGEPVENQILATQGADEKTNEDRIADVVRLSKLFSPSNSAPEPSKAEAESGSNDVSALPKDPLLRELQMRKEQLEQEKNVLPLIESKFNELNVSLISSAKSVEGLRTKAQAERDLKRLWKVFDCEPDGDRVLARHLTHSLTHAAPVVLGSYQMRMPPMVGEKNAISIPLVFLAHIYCDACTFGYTFAKAKQALEMERLLSGDKDQQQSGNVCGLYDIMHPETETAEGMPAEGGKRGSAAAKISSKEVVQHINQRVLQLFGSRQELVNAIEDCFRQAASQKEAQQRLDVSMLSGAIPFLTISTVELQCLVLEGATFGRYLWDAHKP